MILVKDSAGSKSGTTDSTLVGVFDSKRPLYRLIKWLILHIFPPVFRLLYGFRVVGRIPEEKMKNGCIRNQDNLAKNTKKSQNAWESALRTLVNGTSQSYTMEYIFQKKDIIYLHRTYRRKLHG